MSCKWMCNEIRPVKSSMEGKWTVSQTVACSWYNVVPSQRRSQSIVRTDLTEFGQTLQRCTIEDITVHGLMLKTVSHSPVLDGSWSLLLACSRPSRHCSRRNRCSWSRFTHTTTPLTHATYTQLGPVLQLLLRDQSSSFNFEPDYSTTCFNIISFYNYNLVSFNRLMSSVLWHCWLGGRNSRHPVSGLFSRTTWLSQHQKG